MICDGTGIGARRYLVRRGREEEAAGRNATARALYEAALRTATSDGDPSSAALFRWIAATHRAEGDAAAAVDCLHASQAVARLDASWEDRAHALNWVGIIHQDRGDLDRADRLFRRARRLGRRAGDRRLVAMVDQNLGINANIRGDVDRALDHYRRSLKAYRRLGDERLTAQVLNDKGMAHTDLSQWDAAAGCLDESAALCERVRDGRTRVMVQVNRVELALARDNLEAASQACDDALVLAERLGQEPVLGEVYRWLGAVHRRAGEVAEAEHYLLKATEIAERYASPLLAGEAQGELAELYRDQDRNRDALVALSYARRVFAELRARRDLAEVGRRLRELETAFTAVVRRWGESIESKDRYTAGHCRRVAGYAVMLAEAAGLEAEELPWFRMGAFLHDVGKIAVPGSILNKPGTLTEAEHRIMRRHTEVGATIVSGIDFPWDIVPMVRNHHERWDGAGYPDGLTGLEIPLPARILCVADVYDALTTTRSYRPAYAPEEALAIMESEAGTALDPDLFRRFRALLTDRLAGERVRVA